MSQKTIILTGILFALIVLGMFVFATLRQAEMSEAVVNVTQKLIGVL